MDIPLNTPFRIFHSTSRFFYSSYRYAARMTTYWKESLMIVGIATSVIGIAYSIFFKRSRFQTLTFALLLTTNVLGYYYLRRFSTLNSFETTSAALKKTQLETQATAESLHQENNTLRQSNHELRTSIQQLNQANTELQTSLQHLHTLEQTNSQLSATNINLEELNRLLTQQVAQLTLQVTQLTSTSEKIHHEMTIFQSQNSHLNLNVSTFNSHLETLSQAITTSRSLCNTIDTHFKTQQDEFSGQILELRNLIATLKADNSTNEKLSQLILLNKEIEALKKELINIKTEYTAELSRFSELADAFDCLRKHFFDINNDLLENINELKDETGAISKERKRLELLFERASSVSNKENSATDFY
jgi:chromosome segregation ATPase